MDGTQLVIPFVHSGIRLLIVDDHEETRLLLHEFFADHGYFVHEAGTGSEAIEQFDAGLEVDVVLLDVLVPDIGGLELLGHILDRHEPPSVIMVTALNDREVARQAIQMGAFDCIKKPFDFVELESSIHASIASAEFHHQSWWRRWLPNSA